MTSEIRSNIIKNRVGLGTVSFTDSGPVVSGIVTSNGLDLNDDIKIRLGVKDANPDGELTIHHSSSNVNFIKSPTNRTLQIFGNGGVLMRGSGNQNIAHFLQSSVKLYQNQSLKLETTSAGVSIPLDLDVDGHTNLDNVSVAGISTFSDQLLITNNTPILRFTESDNSTASRILMSAGVCYIQAGAFGSGATTSNGQVWITGYNGQETYAKFIGNGAVELYHNNVKKLETASGGVNVTGTVVANNLYASGAATIKASATDTDVFNIIRSDHSSTKLLRIFQDSTSGGGAGGCHINTNNRHLMITANVNAGADDGIYLKTSGEVGINNSSPTAKLDVLGDTILQGNLSVTGVTTTSDDINIPVTNKKLKIGASQQLQLYNQGYHSRIDHVGGHWLSIRSNAVGLFDASDNYFLDGLASSGAVRLYFSNSPKLATTSTGIELLSTDSGAAAGPVLRLQRDSSSPANGDILGQIMFGGKDSTPNDEQYAMVAGKIIQAGAGGEHGAIEITTRKNSAHVITANLTSTDYQLLNGTNLSVDGDITGNGNFQLTSADTGSAAAPELTLHRNSTSPADADYLGQIKFTGKHDAGSTVNYAKITGKILDASNGTEDGILEFMLRKAGSNNIAARFRSDKLQLINGTGLEVDGVTTLAHTGSNQLIIKDSDTSGDTAHMRISFQDSGGTEKFFVGNDNSNGWLYLGSASGQNNNIAFRVNGQDKFQVNSSGAYVNGALTVAGNADIADSIIHTNDTDTKIRFPSSDQISFETGGVDRGRFDNDGNFLIGTTGHGNAGAGARHLVISGPSNQGLTINSTNTSGIYRDCNIYFGYGTSTNDMAKGQLTYSGNGDYLHMSVGNTAYTLAKSFRLNSDGTVRFDSTHTNANSQSLVIKSHKARALNDNNGIVFRDANDHTQAVINVPKKSTSDATSDLVFRTSSGQVVNTLQGIPERMRITSDGHVLPATTNTYDLGSTSKRWRNVYTNDLNLSNEGGSNDVDGTWGSYTIQEGEDDLFLINKRSGKKYKFNLTEVS